MRLILDATKLYEKTLDSKDLERMYDEFNKEYFNNSLDTYPIEWTSSKDIVGSVKSKYDSRTDTYIPQSITISYFYDLEGDQLKGIVLHEMIHVWEGENGYLEENVQHGLEFSKKRRELNKITNFEIPMVEDSRNLKVRNTGSYKDYLVAFFENTKNIQVYNLSKKDSILEDFSKLPKAYFEANPISFYVSEALDLQQYPVKQKLPKKWGAYPISASLAEEIQKGELIKEFH